MDQSKTDWRPQAYYLPRMEATATNQGIKYPFSAVHQSIGKSIIVIMIKQQKLRIIQFHGSKGLRKIKIFIKCNLLCNVCNVLQAAISQINELHHLDKDYWSSKFQCSAVHWNQVRVLMCTPEKNSKMQDTAQNKQGRHIYTGTHVFRSKKICGPKLRPAKLLEGFGRKRIQGCQWAAWPDALQS